jgi:peptide/nickel transport system substrate-binding protein
MSSGSSFWNKVTAQRISRRRALQMTAIGGASAGAIAIVGCGGSSSNNKTPASGTTPAAGKTAVSEGTPKPGGTLHGTVSLVLGKDPYNASTFLTHALASYSYSRLLRFKTVIGELPQDQWYTTEMELAAKVENPDPLTYIFTLRDDVKWHNVPPVNGRKLTGDDVVYSFTRFSAISPNKADLVMVDSVTANGQVVTFKLKEPFGLFLNRIASFQDLWIMPKEFVESSPTASEDRMLGSGPFIFDKFTPSVEMAWKKNPDYFEKDAAGNPLPYLDAVNLAIITDQNQVLSQFASGALDTISVPPTLVDSTKSQSPTAIFDQAPRNILSMMIFEPASYTAAKPPFNDDRVRQAVSMAINRDALLKRVTPQGGLWPNMPINGGFGKSWWLDPQGSDIGPSGANYKYDVAAAKQLLSAAGFPNGFDVPMHFASTVYTTIVPYYPIVKDGLTALFQQVGINVKEVPEEYGSYIGTTFEGKFDGMAFSLESVFSDIAAYWENMFYPKDAGGGRNHSSVNDADLQANIKKMLAAQTVDEIQKQNFELQKYTSQKMYYVPAVTPVEYAARTPKMKGVPNTTGPTSYSLGTEGALRIWLSA